MGKIVLGIIAFVILMIMFPLVMTSTHNIQTDQQTDPALALGGTPPVGTCTLTKALWQDAVGSVISVVGNKPETLTITSYAPTTKVLTVGAVTSSTIATVIYETDGLTEFTGMGALVGFTPLLIWIAFVGSILGGLFITFKGKFGGG